MANAWFNKGGEKQLKGQINWETDVIQAHLVSADYTLNLTTHEFVSDLGANILATVTLGSKVISGKTFDAADVLFTGVGAGESAARVIISKSTGVAATSPLLLNIDEITYFPITTNGADVPIQWSNATSKIMTL